jgi:hypothetical protein
MIKKRLFLSFIVLIIVIAAITTIGIIYNKFNPYSEQEFTSMVTELEKEGYTIDIQDVDKDILIGKRKWLTLNDDEHITVYLYRNKRHMNKDAARVSLDGCGYNGTFRKMQISWTSYPHFFKKDNIIVLYVGENKELIKSLEGLFQNQFAGYIS